MPQPLLELHGDPAAPILHLAPANGFVLQSYAPLYRELAGWRVLSCPPRALWGDGAPPPWETVQSWEHLADDLLSAWDAYQLGPLVAMGHSFGGIASLLATIQRPQAVRALILLDPTLLHPNVIAMMADLKAQGLIDQHPLTQGALRRKRDFDSAEAAYERWRGSRLFADWDDEALRLYAQHGTRPKPEGGVTLTWPAEWEAFYFSTGWMRTWDDLGQLDGLTPTLIVRGQHSDIFVDDTVERVRALLPSADYAEVAGHGHLFPQSAPQQTAALVQHWLQAGRLIG